MWLMHEMIRAQGKPAQICSWLRDVKLALVAALSSPLTDSGHFACDVLRIDADIQGMPTDADKQGSDGIT